MSVDAMNTDGTNASSTRPPPSLSSTSFNDPMVVTGAIVAVFGNILISLSYQVIPVGIIYIYIPDSK